MLKFIHSYWAYLVVIVLVAATINAIIGVISKKEFGAKDFRVSLFALIVTHIQFLLGAILYFVSDKMEWFNDDLTVKDIMKNADLRLFNIEHPIVMMLGIALLTVGYSKHKKKLVSESKFKVLAIFYSLALLLILSRIPWKVWF